MLSPTRTSPVVSAAGKRVPSCGQRRGDPKRDILSCPSFATGPRGGEPVRQEQLLPPNRDAQMGGDGSPQSSVLGLALPVGMLRLKRGPDRLAEKGPQTQEVLWVGDRATCRDTPFSGWLPELWFLLHSFN